MDKTKIAVVMGGRSGEHPVSLRSGTGIIMNLDYNEYAVCPVVISEEGLWHCADGYSAYGPDKNFVPEIFLKDHPRGSLTLPAFLVEPATRPDAVFPIIHGRFGEDGTLQGLFEMHGLRYAGSGVLGSSLAMHKRLAKEMYLHHKIPTPEYSFYTRKQWAANAMAVATHVVEKLGLPVFIKTPEGGSSIGMGMARTREEVREIGDRLFDESEEVLFEKAVKGTEVSCGVLETPSGECEALLPTEIVPVSSAFFDYKAKYEKNASREITPARIPPEIMEKVRRLAVAAHTALHCRGMSRTDMMIAGEAIYVLETNTLPGFTETSLLPQGAKACGISYPELLDRILRCAMRDR